MTKHIPEKFAAVVRALWLCALLGGELPAAPAVAQTSTNSGMRETTVSPDSFIRGAPLPPWFQRESKLPQAVTGNPVVMRFADTHFRVDAEPIGLYHRAIQVIESSALTEIGQYSIAFQPDYQHVHLHWMKVHRGGAVIDKLADASVRFYHGERNAAQGIYTGSITAVVIPQDIRPGDTLEIIYSIAGQNPVFGGRFSDFAAWETTVPVLRRRVTLDLPKDRSVAHRVIGATKPPDVAEFDRGGRHLIRFEAENLAAIDQEELTPPDVQSQSMVQFSEYRDWRDVAGWATGLFAVGDADRFSLPDLGAPTDKTTLLMRALEFVQDNVRYLSISIGENSHRPYPPTEVLARRYGDCKDKTLLLVSILRRLGIEAYPVLVSAQTRKGLNDMLPSPALFDHAIVRASIGGKAYYLDPTLQHQARRLDTLGLILPGAEALVVRDGVRGLETMPTQHTAPVPTTRRLERVMVQRMDQPVDMSVELTYRDEDAEGLRRVLNSMSPAQIRKAYEGLLDRRYPQVQFVGEPQISDDRDKNLLTIQLSYRIPNFFEKAEGRWNLRYEVSNITGVLPYPNNAKRRFPIFVSAFPWIASYALEITLPEDYDADYKPERRSLQAEAFKLDELLTFKGRQLGAQVDLVLTRDRVAAAGTPQFLTDLREASGYFRGSLSITDRALRQKSNVSVPLKDLSRQQLEQALRNSANAIAAARSDGRETAASRCEHALAAAYLDQPESARADADAAVAEQPASPDTLRCRGTVRFVVGDFEAAVRDLDRALGLSPDDAETYFRRGLAHYYAGHWRKAIDDFVTYGKRSKNERDKARASVWRTLALRQDGTTQLPADVSPTVWPAPALGMFANKASAEDILENLNRSERGLQLEEATAEAYFYFSRYFAISNRVKARAYLRRSLDLGAMHSLVQVAARHEMKRLDDTAQAPARTGKQP